MAVIAAVVTLDDKATIATMLCVSRLLPTILAGADGEAAAAGACCGVVAA